MTAPVETVMQTLPYNDAIPGAVLEQVKTGLVVAPDRVTELARYLRDQQGYDYCSMVTSVDWPQYFEVVYYLFGVAQPKDALVLRVRLTDKANPVMPSLTSNLARRRLPGTRSLRHDGDSLRGTPQSAAHSPLGRV